jgi:probable rRNA maturation factor
MTRKANPRAATRRRSAIALIVEDSRWRKDAATLRLIRRAVRLALAAPPSGPSGHLPRRRGRKDIASVTILLADDARLKTLNFDFRGVAKPTNVLAFPSPHPAYLGDVAIAYETTAREARAQAKSISAHAAHLAMHGILHLLGYDHEGRATPKPWNRWKRNLGEFGLADPYAARPLTRGRKAA